MHFFTRTILVAGVAFGAYVLATTLVGAWLGILAGLGAIVLYAAYLYWDEHRYDAHPPWRR
jgi:hypothetical protein